MKLRFFLYFLLFAYVPLLIFSVIGYFLNKEILKQIYEQDLERYISVWIEKNQMMADFDRVLCIAFLESAENEAQFIKNLKKLSIHYNHEVVGVITAGKLSIVDSSSFRNSRLLNHLLSRKEELHFNISDSSFYKFVKLDSAVSVIIRYPFEEIFSRFEVTDKASRIFLVSLNDGIVVSHEEVRVFQLSNKNARQKFGQFLSALTGDENWLTMSAELGSGWKLIYQSSTAMIFIPLKKFLFQIIVANLLLGILLFFFAILTAQSISKPLRSLVFAANQISRGHLGHKVPIEGKDEIKELANEFETMRQKLLESYQNLEKKIEERTKALREAQFQISHQEKMASLGILAAGVAHEIGNPLTSISSMAQIIKRKVKDDSIEEYINTILANIERISKIVRELVDFSRPSGLESSWVNINDVIRNAIGIVKYDKRAKNVNFRLSLAEDLPNLYLVSDQLLQVFLNIMINALDALKNGKGTIEINTAQSGQNVIITIKDDGMGIPEDHLNKIFEPFFTTKEVGHGTGLGLSVSYGIIKNFNGKIEVQSKVGEGSRFTIKLPLNTTTERDHES
ncbi:MAG: HAMP domain-containing protein [Calditrichaeota bacterium]|nr:HAMP domain-containing protein [Calditrichota bacterium]